MKRKVTLALCACILMIAVGIAVGSVYIPPGQMRAILGHRLFGRALPETTPPHMVSILWNLRLPRVFLAFLAGAALSVSGAVMQSVLRNPLASSYTLGVSSGASLGATLVLLYGATLPLLGGFSLPIFGFVFGMGTIVLAILFATRIDGQMENNTIILVGVVFTLFVGSITTLLATMERTSIQRLIFWQMGSFSMRDWDAVWILLPIVLIGILWLTRLSRELDILTFGEGEAQAIGVDVKPVKWKLLLITAAVTGSTIAFVGLIGFVDLVVPHVVRRIFGSRHRLMLPMSALVGGGFMVLCDLAARMVIPHQELPVGVVTALLGAPFFVWIYRQGRAK